jgi:hypothetical protein
MKPDIMEPVAVIELSEEISGSQNDDQKSPLPSTSQPLTESAEGAVIEKAGYWKDSVSSCWNAFGHQGKYLAVSAAVLTGQAQWKVGAA